MLPATGAVESVVNRGTSVFTSGLFVLSSLLIKYPVKKKTTAKNNTHATTAYILLLKNFIKLFYLLKHIPLISMQKDAVKKILSKLSEYGEVTSETPYDRDCAKVLYTGILTLPKRKVSEMCEALNNFGILKEYPLAFISYQPDTTGTNVLRIKFKIFNKRDIT